MPTPVSPLPNAQAAVVDLFAGLGCVAAGFSRGGRFVPVALVDVDTAARDSFIANGGHGSYLVRGVEELDPSELRECAGGAPIAGVLGCPPCQGFSAAGKRCAGDPRNKLLYSYFSVVSALRPAFFVLENVPSIVYQPELYEFLAAQAPDYLVWRGVLNAACYGLPQTRQRAIVIGYLRDLGVTPTPPPPTHFGTRPVFDYRTASLLEPSAATTEALLGESPHIGVPRDSRMSGAAVLPESPASLESLVQVGEAIGDLPTLEADRCSNAPSEYALSLGAGNASVANHVRWRHTDTTVARLRSIPEGGSPLKGRYYSQAYARLHRRGLSRTITTNFHNPGCGRFTHYAEPRSLTVREAARLQGIRDEFELVGRRSTQERLVGNAFPPLWAEAISRQIRHQVGQMLDSAEWSL